MLKLVIADDESIIRDTISTIIDWSSIGIQLIGVCKNGVEAWHMIQKELPDIVLTDIRMPGLSGLDLVEKTTMSKLNTEFILLSGYADFEYAKTAIQYKVNNYLLKPCNEDEIKEAIFRVSKEIIKKKKIQELLPDHLLQEAVIKTGYKEYVRKILTYIDENLDDPNLSLKWIAENILFMNVDYLSKEFYKQTGQKFTDYLISARIERAKILLKINTDKKIYTIAEQVGYPNNPQYFVQLFKNMTGLTPRAYARQFTAPNSFQI